MSLRTKWMQAMNEWINEMKEWMNKWCWWSWWCCWWWRRRWCWWYWQQTWRCWWWWQWCWGRIFKIRKCLGYGYHGTDIRIKKRGDMAMHDRNGNLHTIMESFEALRRQELWKRWLSLDPHLCLRTKDHLRSRSRSSGRKCERRKSIIPVHVSQLFCILPSTQLQTCIYSMSSLKLKRYV